MSDLYPVNPEYAKCLRWNACDWCGGRGSILSAGGKDGSPILQETYEACPKCDGLRGEYEWIAVPSDLMPLRPLGEAADYLHSSDRLMRRAAWMYYSAEHYPNLYMYGVIPESTRRSAESAANMVYTAPPSASEPNDPF